MTWQASPETEEDLIAARDFIAADNEQAARDFLDAAFETFDRVLHRKEISEGRLTSICIDAKMFICEQRWICRMTCSAR